MCDRTLHYERRGVLVKLETTGAFAKVENGAVVVVNQSRVAQALHVMAMRQARDDMEMVEVD